MLCGVNYGQSIAFHTKPGLHQNSRMNSMQNIRCFAANILKAHALLRRSCSEQLYLVFNAIRSFCRESLYRSENIRQQTRNWNR
ncbi:unnamed protein product [Arctia plantaginis]|uniref:Uncharacterized protein n=1 Tax=Arctia plantaginis TaxID=874455 RepID=A0A8S1BDL4_ARCPL|nr:unnamed protein product [Arctia plantaginis]CAB3257080.1 unnamed protein product [Arctia plantaginis]